MKCFKMKKLTFKHWYAIIFLAVFAVYGWLYLKEHRYVVVGNQGYMFDTWVGKYKDPSHFTDD